MRSFIDVPRKFYRRIYGVYQSRLPEQWVERRCNLWKLPKTIIAEQSCSLSTIRCCKKEIKAKKYSQFKKKLYLCKSIIKIILS